MESVPSTNLGMSMSILNSKTLPKTVEIYDTTLRDGAQLEGISLTVDDKLRIAEQLDNLGVHYIEGGWPGANPKDVEFFEISQKELPLKQSRLVAFGSTRRVNRSDKCCSRNDGRHEYGNLVSRWRDLF